MSETIQNVSIADETRRRYLNYALSVITSRALPDVRDGLKPVHRRILYTMYHDLHLHADARPAKCATIVGQVIGHYHPHGDVAAYDALVRMAQDFSMRERLVDGHGNFGSVDGDPAAHYRYTESKLTPLADRLMAELRRNTVDHRPNFANTKQEPIVLPAQYPNLLVNGTSGIAVGMATNIPPHNLAEVIDACVHLIDNEEATTAQLLRFVKGPDFPLGGKIVTDKTALRKIYEDGAGSIRVQAEWKVERDSSKNQIVVTSIPYGVNKGNLESAIGEIIANRKLPQLTNLVNESNEKEGLRIALEMKKDADPEMIMAYLYRHTALQDNFSYNLTCLVPGADGQPQPERLGLKAIIRHFIDFRFTTVKRRFEYDLEVLRRRIHVLDGFRIIFNGLDQALKLIRASSGRADAAERLMQAFKLDQEQADAIVDAQLYRIAQLEIKKILNELKEKRAEAEAIEAILRSNKRLWGVVKTELAEVSAKFGANNKRRTKLAFGEEVPEFDPEAYITRENTNVVLTRDGWVKRVGKLAAVESTRVREGDEVIAVAPGSTLDHVIFFADDGAAYTMRMNEVPASSGYGEPVAKYFRLGDQVKLVNAVSTDERFTPPSPESEEARPPFLLVVTARGQTLRIPLGPYRTASTKVGRRYARLRKGDRVVLAVVLKEDDANLILASHSGRIIQFALEEINILSGAGVGVMGIKLKSDDFCLGGAIISPRMDRLTVETGAGGTQEYRTDKYEVTSRGGKGFEAVKRTHFTRVVPPAIQLVDWEEVDARAEETSRNGNGKQKQLFD